MTTAPGWVPETDFGIRLLLARKHAGLTVREAAIRCGLHYATWSTWERGARPADMATVVDQIAQGLGVDRVWLAWGEEDPRDVSPAVRELRQAKRAIRANGQSSTRCTHSLGQRRAAKVLRSSWLNRPAHNARPSAA